MLRSPKDYVADGWGVVSKLLGIALAVAAVWLIAALVARPASAQESALGTIADVLLDMRAKGVHYALLEVPASSPAAARRGPENLRIAPGYEDRAWPDGAFRDDSRYVLASDLIGSTARDALGNPIARIADVVISLRTGLTERVIFDFDDGIVLSLPAHAVRLRPGGAVILGDPGRRA